jgi:hypothetical protein
MTSEKSVLLIGYNRPVHMQQVLDSLIDWPISNLYVSIDGPKSLDDFANVKSVQKIIQDHRVSGNQKYRFLQRNLGCKKHVLDALKWFFLFETEGIVLEDDCLPDISFYNFGKSSLDLYRNATEVLMVTGTRFNLQNSQPHLSTFSSFPHVWGWASWKDRVENYLENIENPEITSPLEAIKNTRGLGIINSLYWALISLNMKFNRIDTWDYQLALFAFKHKMLTFVPPINLIENTGFNSDSTNFFFKANKYISQKRGTLPVLENVYISPTKNLEYDRNFIAKVIKSSKLRTIFKPLGTLIIPKILIITLKSQIKKFF